MNFFDELGDIATGGLDTIGDFVTSIGDNAVTQSEANAAKVEAIKINNQLAVQKFKAEQKRKDEDRALIKNVTYFVLFVALLLIAAKYVIPKIK